MILKTNMAEVSQFFSLLISLEKRLWRWCGVGSPFLAAIGSHSCSSASQALNSVCREQQRPPGDNGEKMGWPLAWLQDQALWFRDCLYFNFVECSSDKCVLALDYDVMEGSRRGQRLRIINLEDGWRQLMLCYFGLEVSPLKSTCKDFLSSAFIHVQKQPHIDYCILCLL